MAWTDRQIAMLAEMGLQVPAVRSRGTTTLAAPTATDARSADTTVAVLEAPSQVSSPTEGVPAVRPVAAPAVHSDAVPAGHLDAVPAADADTADAMRVVAQPVTRAPAPSARTGPALPQRSEFAQLGWPALRETVAGCTACALCDGRTQTVFGVGSTEAHWMVVGEAPGNAEDASGEPFVGKTGQLLDNMLAALGLSRSLGGPGEETPDPATRAFITNAVKCRPPGGRNPTPDELATCEPYLMRQVELLKPKIILAMGTLAVQRLLQTAEPIGRLRGRVHRWQGVPLIVTFHPGYLLRSPTEKARAWDDLCLARETYLGAPAPS